MNTKYNFEINNTFFSKNCRRLVNQLWKLIPMRENKEDWQSQLKTVIIEINGMSKIFNTSPLFLQLLSKLEGLSDVHDFQMYRKTVFEGISLLQEISHVSNK